MAAIVCRMIEKETDADNAKGETAFDDVVADYWASGYINLASKQGIINGDGNGKFRPQDDVKYEEAIKMVVCALGYGDDVKVDLATNSFKNSSKILNGNIAYVPDYICKIPEKIQGLTSIEGFMIFSSSYGRTNKSSLMIYETNFHNADADDYIVIEGRNIGVYSPLHCYTVTAPPMTEGITVVGDDRIAVLFESGAKKYREDGGKHPTDRLWVWKVFNN